MPANLENSAVVTGLAKVSFHPNPKERQCQRMLKLPHIVLISHASEVMLKILQARLQQYVNRELPDVQAGFRKRNQRSNCQHPMDHRKSTRVPENIYFCFIDSAKALTLWLTITGGILKEMEIPNHVTFLLKPICRSGSRS